MKVKVISESPEETTDFGRRLARQLRSGDIVLLKGPLGAGKTALVKGVASGLDEDVARLVSSQSYVVVGEYPTSPMLVHLDLYRLESVEEVLALGYEELLYGDDRIAMIEWPELLEPLLEEDDPCLTLQLDHSNLPERRLITAKTDKERLMRAFLLASEGMIGVEERGLS